MTTKLYNRVPLNTNRVLCCGGTKEKVIDPERRTRRERIPVRSKIYRNVRSLIPGLVFSLPVRFVGRY